jgi:PrtD family type I secretion system ABC transporter
MINFLVRFKVNPTLLAALTQCRAHFTNAALFSFFINLLNLAPTLYMLQVYSRVVPTGGVMTLVYLTAILLASLATLSLLDTLRGRLLVRSGMRLDKILAGQVLNHLYAQPANRKPGIGSTTVLREFDTFKQTLSGQGMTALFDLPWIVIFLGLCFYLHPVLGLLTMAGGILLALVTWLSERASYQYITRSAESMAAAYARQEATAQKADVIRALGMRQSMVASQLKDRHSALSDQIHANMSVSGFTTASKFLRQFLQSVALGVGAWLAIHQQISAGAIFAASLLMSRALTPMEQVIASWRSLIRGYNAFKHVNGALNAQTAQAPLTALPAPRGLVEIENLTIPHQDQKSFILQSVSFRVSPGDLVGVAGPSGVGKSTLARALVGSDPYDVGTIRFDGAERRDWDPEALARHIGYLPQDSALFGGTIRDNICRFETPVDGDYSTIDAAVVVAAKLAGVHEMILQLSKGYNTVLGQNGQGLSGGQGQRVALARALYRDPAVLVLDEPNAYQDAAGEAALISAMSSVCQRGGSVIVIAHRTTVLERATRLLMLANGRVQFYGTPQAWTEAVQRQRGTLATVAGGKAGAN